MARSTATTSALAPTTNLTTTTLPPPHHYSPINADRPVAFPILSGEQQDLQAVLVEHFQMGTAARGAVAVGGDVVDALLPLLHPRHAVVERDGLGIVGVTGGREAQQLAYTLVETAKMNGLDPQAWLTEVLHRISEYPSNRIDEFLPWNCKPDKALSDAA